MKSSGSRTYDGWFTKHKVNRMPNDYEIKARLIPGQPIDLPPVDSGLLKFNSVYLECIDRYYLYRGLGVMMGLLCSLSVIFCMVLVGAELHSPKGWVPKSVDIMILCGVILALFAMLGGVVYFLFSKEFFCYTHYPIRFNRKNKKVYVFLNNSPGGVLEVDWLKGYWFVGRSNGERGWGSDYDLRCHVTDSDGMIRHTFAVGKRCRNRAEVLQGWELIRFYMENSPSGLPFPPLGLCISTRTNFRNVLIMQMSIVGAGLHPLVLLLSVPWAFLRWISQKTCRAPCWPMWVDEVCTFPADDPFIQPEPIEFGVVERFDSEMYRALEEYRQQADIVAQKYEGQLGVAET